VGLGAEVTFIHGPLGVALPPGADSVPVETAREMCDAVLDALPRVDALAMAAAVADFRAASVADQKIKKLDLDPGTPISIRLEATQDILSAVAGRKSERQVVVGFAMETDESAAHERVRDRIDRKGLDLAVLNMIGQSDAGFAADTNRVTVFDRDGAVTELELMDKEDVALQIWERVVTILDARDVAEAQADG